MESRKKTVLFVCTGNAGRSQIALTLFQKMVGDDVRVVSAGVDPWPGLHPVARGLLQEKGFDVSELHPKHVASFVGMPLDFVVTIGDRAGNETPRLGGDPIRLHWEISDPADADGTGEEDAVFRRTLELIEARLPALVTLVEGQPEADALYLAPGISTCIVRPQRFDPATHLPLIADAGFKCIELNCYLGSDDFAWDMPAAAQELGRVAADTGVNIFAVHAAGGVAGLRGGHSHELALDLCKVYADLAADLGAPVVTMHAGLDQGKDTAKATRRLRQTLDELSRHVVGMPCRYAWENTAQGLSPAEQLAWLRDLDPAAFSFVWDTGHSNIGGTTQAYLDDCRGLLCDLHLNDNAGDRDAHQLPGYGTFPWANFGEALESCEYVGPLMLEVLARDRQDDLPAVLREARLSIDHMMDAAADDEG